MAEPREQRRPSYRACNRTHGTVGDHLLSLVPRPAPEKDRGDPFLTLSPRAAKTWLALFAHAQQHGAWRPQPTSPLRLETAEDRKYTLTAHWTVAGLGHALGVNRDTAGKALQELVEGGWMRREDPRNKGQFGGIDYCFTSPTTVTCADKAKVAEGLKRRGVEYRNYEWRTAARVLDEHEMQQVRQDVELEIETERADLRGDEEKAVELAAKCVLRQQMAEEEQFVPSARRAKAMMTLQGDEEARENAEIRMR